MKQLKDILWTKKFNVHTDWTRGGCLVPVDFSSIPFVVKRVFYVGNVPAGSIRGEHAHYRTKQVILCSSGNVLVDLYDGHDIITVNLLPGDSVLLDALVWGTQKFIVDDSSLIVFCSTEYDELDYIRNEDHFNQIVNDKYNIKENM